MRSSTRFRGKVPDNACGLIHTHPRNKPAPPSDCEGCDKDVSKRLGIPIYTVRPSGIWKYDPSTDVTTQEETSKWSKEARKQCGKRPCEGLIE